MCKIADFLQNKRFFSDIPEGFAFLGGHWGVFLAQLSTRNTFFSLWVCPKMGFFSPKDRTYRAIFVLFNKRKFLRIVPKGLNAIWTFVHAAESAN